jgi:hypothetical protein
MDFGMIDVTSRQGYCRKSMSVSGQRKAHRRGTVDKSPLWGTEIEWRELVERLRAWTRRWHGAPPLPDGSQCNCSA